MKKELFDSNPILKLSFDFPLMITEYCEKLKSTRKYILARQLLRSGTSIGATAMEAQNAESKVNFNPKFKIAAKEAEEFQYWLCQYSTNHPESPVERQNLKK